MHRRPRPVTPVRHSPFTLRTASPAPTCAELHHTFELAAVLESHAVSRVAAAAMRDLLAARQALAELERAIDAGHLAQWAALEIRVHRALDDQGGNLVLASMAERTLRDGLTACPILTPDVLRALHAQHHAILRCVAARDAEGAVRHTRAHLVSLRDALIGAQRIGPRTRLRLPS
ncbi:MAG: FCD domain-containing protein [Chloroflexi bacterium]|nr:FCD domain-containing protein [Chloroflexota bacterium]